MTDRNLRKAFFAGDVGDARFMRGIEVAMRNAIATARMPSS
jgi:hypothetical protein